MSTSFASCFANMADLAVCRDPQRRIVYVNAAFARTFGGTVEDWAGRCFDGAESGAQIGAFHDMRAYGHVRVGGRSFWIEWDEAALPGGGTIAMGRLNRDRRTATRSRESLERDRRRNKAALYVPPLRSGKAMPPPANVAKASPANRPVETVCEAPTITIEAKTQVLLVEDDPLSDKLATALLEREACAVTHAPDGETALELARGRNFDMVLMDMRLPGMDGPQTCEAIRALGAGWAGTPIIALTANAFEEDRKICRAAGMTGFVTKPIDVQTLSAVRERWTGRGKLAKLA